jgi:molybdate transport system permease protein
MTLSPEEWTAIFLSLKVALLATFMCLPVATALAWLLTHRNFWGKSALNSLIHLPLVLPPVVTGYLLLVAFGKKGILGAFFEHYFGLVFSFRWTGAALAAGVMALPLTFQAIRVSMEVIDHRLESAAATLGASPWRVFATVTLPLAAPGLLAGAMITYVKALGEFGATITFVASIPGETQTLALSIYSLLQTPDGGMAALRLTFLSIGLAFLALIASEHVTKWLARSMRDEL